MRDDDGLLENPGGRPRKYASAAERQAAYRERFVQFPIRMGRDTAETLERIGAATGMARSELCLQMIKFALANRDWYNDPRFARPLTAQAMDDRRRATKFQPMPVDSGEDDEDA